MSIGVSGILYADKKDASYMIETSFYFEKIANQYGMGSKLGGNVAKEVYNNYLNENKEYLFLFELLDTPIDNFAEELFEPDMYGEIGNETLYERLKRVENVLIKLFNYEHVRKIILDINYLFGLNEKQVVIKASEFANTVISYYQKNDISIPVIRVIIER